MARTITVKVRPNARTPSLELQEDGIWLARVKAPPTDGRANREVIAAVARRFDVPPSTIVIRRGAGARYKVLELPDPAA